MHIQSLHQASSATHHNRRAQTPPAQSRMIGIRILDVLSINFVLPPPTLLVRNRLRGRKLMRHVCPILDNPGCRHRRKALAGHCHQHCVLARPRGPALPPGESTKPERAGISIRISARTQVRRTVEIKLRGRTLYYPQSCVESTQPALHPPLVRQ